jgi:hypothetical protein
LYMSVNRNFIIQFNFVSLFFCTSSSYHPISNFFPLTLLSVFPTTTKNFSSMARSVGWDMRVGSPKNHFFSMRHRCKMRFLKEWKMKKKKVNSAFCTEFNPLSIHIIHFCFCLFFPVRFWRNKIYGQSVDPV